MAAKLIISVVGILLLVPVLLGIAVQGAISAVFGSDSSTNSMVNCTQPIADIPPNYCTLYVTAAPVCPGLDWSILAAIGDIESDHGRSRLTGVADGTENHMGAGGPMQFLKPTFDGVLARHTIPPGGTTPPSRYNPHDAIHAAAFTLCDAGAPHNLHQAFFANNQSETYVQDILARANTYADTAAVGSGDCNTIQAPNAATQAAINYACGQRGLPYVWGG